MKLPRFIVTGSNGYIGKKFLLEIKKRNISTITISNPDEWAKIDVGDNNEYSNFLIHTAFKLPKKIAHQNTKKYKDTLVKGFNELEQFIHNSRVEAVLYPSSGRIYEKNSFNSGLLKVYSEQKVYEEKKLIDLSKKNDFKIIIPRIFSLLGPSEDYQSYSTFNSILHQAKSEKKIQLISNPSNIHSISILDNFVGLILNIILKNDYQSKVIFDVVDESISLLEFAKLIMNSLNLQSGNISFDSINQKKNDYVGDSSMYRKLKSSYLPNEISLIKYLEHLSNS